MQALTNVSSAIVGAVLGFFIGIYLAAITGLHAPIHVLPLALSISAICGSASIIAARKYVPPRSASVRAALAAFLVLLALVAIRLFIGILS